MLTIKAKKFLTQKYHTDHDLKHSLERLATGQEGEQELLTRKAKCQAVSGNYSTELGHKIREQDTATFLLSLILGCSPVA